MKPKAIYIHNRIMSIILLALIFMWLMPYGSFKPVEPGFYLSILQALFTEIVTWKLIKRQQTNPENFEFSGKKYRLTDDK